MAKGNIGTVVQVIGPVLDIRFKDGELPQLLNAVEVESGEKKLTIRGFREIIEGKHDDLPESAFLFVGTIDEAVAKAKKGEHA